MILVTGGTGFLGSHLLFSLAGGNKKIRALQRNRSSIDSVRKVFSYYTDNVEEFFSRISWVEGDMLDPFSLEDALDGVSRVYHAASAVSFDPSDRLSVINNNIEGTSNLVYACLKNGVEKLCYVSSVAAIGKGNEGELTTEKDIWKYSKRKSAYSTGKFHSEMEVWRGINEGLNAVIVNPSVILGPGNWTSGSPSFFYRVYRGMKYYTKGVTGFVDVRDVCSCMRGLMESPVTGERFILNSENLLYKELFDLIAGALGKPGPNVYASDKMLEMGWRLEWLRSKLFFSKPVFTKEMARAGRSRTFYSNEKIRETLPFAFRPVRETVEWTARIFLEETGRKNGL